MGLDLKNCKADVERLQDAPDLMEKSYSAPC